MLEQLKQQVFQANLDLVTKGLVHETFGNVSGVDRAAGCVVIKPSGVPYEKMSVEKMVIISLEDSEVLEGELRPSSDTPTHLVLYRAFEQIGGVVHTHSVHGTAWAQALREIPALGTTHADCFCGDIPCTRAMKPNEIQTNYEANTAEVIIERLKGLDPMSVPGVLVASHGPFTWGRSPSEAVQNAVALEYAARLASQTLRIAPDAKSISKELLEKHFFRKHGPDAYYGQE